jgi:hypothetical protein
VNRNVTFNSTAPAGAFQNEDFASARVPHHTLPTVCPLMQGFDCLPARPQACLSARLHLCLSPTRLLARGPAALQTCFSGRPTACVTTPAGASLRVSCGNHQPTRPWRPTGLGRCRDQPRLPSLLCTAIAKIEAPHDASQHNRPTSLTCAGHKYYDITHNGLDAMVARFIEVGEWPSAENSYTRGALPQVLPAISSPGLQCTWPLSVQQHAVCTDTATPPPINALRHS